MKIVPDEAQVYHYTAPCHSLADESAITHLCSVQLHVKTVHFLKLMRAVLKHVPLERWIQLMICGLKTVNLEWEKIVMIGYTWLFIYESARTYEGRMIADPESYTLCIGSPNTEQSEVKQ